MLNKLKLARVALGLTQEDVARRIGVSRQTVNAMESAKYVPSTVLALKVARLLGKPVEELFVLEADD
ncbi:helix-turn-helix transcriptional regulator [Hymenobacter busanensis]|uniref:Helix-turn-helix transcriptional regulator n=1 Tax=Hymenobacter busanensis TaxID=2607656 RepID=A0A7L5A1I6_9BACT|nr:helix-turn-helix transcriptional regulator [Hymenobacter busanensis]KAA9338235.1 helix-turn-helix transcriptional regulator [Hymenobacter busanensis]QHJ09341.1 helix-turn-helix domain-containing protein [Hymenobacter busanensis]